MKKVQWYVRYLVEGDKPYYTKEVGSYFEAICYLFEHLEKDMPFCCKVDFFYRAGED